VHLVACVHRHEGPPDGGVHQHKVAVARRADQAGLVQQPAEGAKGAAGHVLDVPRVARQRRQVCERGLRHPGGGEWSAGLGWPADASQWAGPVGAAAAQPAARRAHLLDPLGYEDVEVRASVLRHALLDKVVQVHPVLRVGAGVEVEGEDVLGDGPHAVARQAARERQRQQRRQHLPGAAAAPPRRHTSGGGLVTADQNKYGPRQQPPNVAAGPSPAADAGAAAPAIQTPREG
jgi:hypothetical protein